MLVLTVMVHMLMCAPMGGGAAVGWTWGRAASTCFWRAMRRPTVLTDLSVLANRLPRRTAPAAGCRFGPWETSRRRGNQPWRAGAVGARLLSSSPAHGAAAQRRIHWSTLGRETCQP